MSRENTGSFFNNYLGGDVFSKASVVKQLPFILYVVFLLMLYITNTYIAEDINREVLVKNFMRSGKADGEVEQDFFGNRNTPYKLITHKPIVPSEEEIARNSRARSAKLRIAELK